MRTQHQSGRIWCFSTIAKTLNGCHRRLLPPSPWAHFHRLWNALISMPRPLPYLASAKATSAHLTQVSVWPIKRPSFGPSPVSLQDNLRCSVYYSGGVFGIGRITVPANVKVRYVSAHIRTAQGSGTVSASHKTLPSVGHTDFGANSFPKERVQNLIYYSMCKHGRFRPDS